MMRFLGRGVILAMGVWGASGTGWADGKVFSRVEVTAEVTMPDQRALLGWENGVQTLVIESAFVGEGAEFAWVVPLPSKPEVEAATRGTLPTMVAVMQPEIVQGWGGTGRLAGMMWLVGLLALAIGWRWCGVVFQFLVIGGLAVAVCLGLAVMVEAGLRGEHARWVAVGLAACAPLVAAVAMWRWRHRVNAEKSWAVFLTAVILGAVLGAVLLPTFSKVRSAAGAMGESFEAGGGVRGERSVVGDFDVTVLTGTGGEGVLAWLEAEGFRVPEEAKAEAMAHTERGGWFVASRVRRGFAESGRSVPDPLGFRFAAEVPVYPMKFTGAGATVPLELELYVLGPAKAEAAGLKAETWGPVSLREPEGWGGDSVDEGRRVLTHPELKRWGGEAAVATRLRGVLSPEAMGEDVILSWAEAGAEAGGWRWYAKKEARARAGLVGGGWVLAVALGVGVARRGGRPRWGWGVGAGWVGVMVTAGVYAALPKVETVETRSSRPVYVDRYRMLEGLQIAGQQVPEAEWSRERLEAAMLEVWGDRKGLGGWRQAALRFGDGPGEVELRALPGGGWRLWFYDNRGRTGYFPEMDLWPERNDAVE